MRPENSSKLWLKTFCERSRESTPWSSVTPFRPAAIADCEIPLAAASVLKSSSHASKAAGAAGGARAPALPAGIRAALSADGSEEQDGRVHRDHQSSEIDSSNEVRFPDDVRNVLAQPRPKQGFADRREPKVRAGTIASNINGAMPNRRSTIDRRLGRDSPSAGYAPSLRRHGNRLAGKSAAGRRSRCGRRRNRPRIGIRRDHLAIEMPGGVAEQRDDDGKPEEQRQRSQHQQHRDDQSPCRHRHRILRHRPQRCHHGVAGAGMTVEHQRERDHADAQRHQRKQETDAAADDDQPPSLRCRQHAPWRSRKFRPRPHNRTPRHRSPARSRPR